MQNRASRINRSQYPYSIKRWLTPAVFTVLIAPLAPASADALNNVTYNDVLAIEAAEPQSSQAYGEHPQQFVEFWPAVDTSPPKALSSCPWALGFWPLLSAELLPVPG